MFCLSFRARNEFLQKLDCKSLIFLSFKSLIGGRMHRPHHSLEVDVESFARRALPGVEELCPGWDIKHEIVERVKSFVRACPSGTAATSKHNLFSCTVTVRQEGSPSVRTQPAHHARFMYQRSARLMIVGDFAETRTAYSSTAVASRIKNDAFPGMIVGALVHPFRALRIPFQPKPSSVEGAPTVIV